jgi:regulator of protease activity HflC (stomatin/prohibitin superfamily)
MALVIIVAFVLLMLFSGFRVLNEYERGVVFRLGRILPPRGAGLTWIIPGIDKMVKISLRLITMDVPSQDIITKDNVSVKVNAVVYFKVIDPVKAILQVENYLYATSQLSQTTLRSVLGQVELDQLLSEREHLNIKLQEVIDKQTDPWGIKVSLVELKYVDLPQDMQRAMAKQAEAERLKRAKVISAEGEYLASARLAEASDILSKNPIAVQLRYLQTLTEIATEKNSTVIFPVPIDLLKHFLETKKEGAEAVAPVQIKGS